MFSFAPGFWSISRNKKALSMFDKELTMEEYARFIAAITPKIWDSVKEQRGNSEMLKQRRDS